MTADLPTHPSTEAVGEVRRDPRYDLSAEAQKLRYAVAEAVTEVDRQWCANIDGAGVDSAIAATITQLRSDLSAMTSDRDWLREELGKAAAEIADLRGERDAAMRNWVDVQDRYERVLPVLEAAGLWRHGGRNHQEQVDLLAKLMDAVDAYIAKEGD